MEKPPGPLEPPQTYVIDGHGSETMCLMTERDVIPDKTVLITFAECGNYVFLADAIPRLESMAKSPREWTKFTVDMTLKDIKDSLPKDLSRSAHVYTAGMRYPKLSLTSLGSSSVTGEIKGPPPRKPITVQRYWKSGVYKLPLTLKDYSGDWEVKQGYGGQTSPWYHKKTGLLATGSGYSYTYRSVKTTPGRDAAVAKSMYEGAILPEEKAQETAIERHMSGTSEDPIPLASIFEKLGPGVYYWMVCRAGPLDETTQALRSASYVAQTTPPTAQTTTATARAGRRRRGRKTYRKKRRVSLKVARR